MKAQQARVIAERARRYLKRQNVSALPSWLSEELISALEQLAGELDNTNKTLFDLEFERSEHQQEVSGG